MRGPKLIWSQPRAMRDGNEVLQRNYGDLMGSIKENPDLRAEILVAWLQFEFEVDELSGVFRSAGELATFAAQVLDDWREGK